MTVQNINTNQAAQPVRHVSDDAPKVVANTPNTEAAPGIAVDANKRLTLQSISSEQLKNAVEIINQVMRHSNNALEFSVDSESKTPIVKLVDTETGQLLRQYPSEATLAISRSIDQFQQQQGLLLQQKA